MKVNVWIGAMICALTFNAKATPKDDLHVMASIYSDLIQMSIKENIDDKYKKNQECRVRIQTEKSGKIKDVTLIAGNEVCYMGINAIWKIRRFPMPQNEKTKQSLQDLNMSVLLK